ncbi:MAG TPA: dTDP-4-dehydrorhamnose 3,5-epimerase [Mycobacteriales bacterium]|jgi:dTDP-4-dehydrorhamnose 3,5-epimerase|nr:dTDP-4-dehydrorhamnose 3,5-epimerase [Mycobacteriales bacterium]
MKIEALGVPDAWVCTPRVHGDDRGAFLEWFRGDALAETTGRRFTAMQANHSTSKRGVVRGVHFADVPPGQAKFVYCPVGAVLDIVIDLRVGSPTFGAVDTVLLDDVERRAVFISEGIGHAFCSLRDDTSVNYLVSSVYDPVAERTVSPLDPTLGLTWPADIGELVMSDKDLAAPSLDDAARNGILPFYDACRERYADLS